MRALRSAIAVLVALALLAGVAWFGDRWARSEVESRIETELTERVPELTDGVEASVGGRFVIPQIVRGSLDDLTLHADEATIDGFAVVDVAIVATGVPIRGAGSIDDVTITGTAPTHTVIAAIEQRVDLPEGVTIELHDGEIAAVATVLGIPLEAYVEPVTQPRTLSFQVSRFVLGGATVDAADIPFDLDGVLADATVDLDMLPAGIDLTDVVVTPQGVDLTLHGTDVSL